MSPPLALNVTAYGAPVAMVSVNSRGGHTWIYDAAYVNNANAFPVSLSLPLAPREHSGPHVTNFLESLLPDHRPTLERWAAEVQVNPNNTIGLLAEYGTDVAGALEFRTADAEAGSPLRATMIEMSTTDIAGRIAAIQSDDTLGHGVTGTKGKFSLPGAQGKFSLLRSDGKWWETAGTLPSTHIFKHGVRNMVDAHLVEHLTMATASALGLPAAPTEVAEFDEKSALIVTRFDRTRLPNGEVIRVHQEDLNQASGTPAWRKYEGDGGLGYRRSLAIFDRFPSADAARQAKQQFACALLFSWLMLGTDAHARNYSIRLLPGGDAVLAPLYDAASYLPYLTEPVAAAMADTELSMQVLGSYRAGDMGATAWQSVARDAGLNPEAFLEWARVTCTAMPEAVHAAASALRSGQQTETVARLVERTPERATACLALLSP